MLIGNQSNGGWGGYSVGTDNGYDGTYLRADREITEAGRSGYFGGGGGTHYDVERGAGGGGSNYAQVLVHGIMECTLKPVSSGGGNASGGRVTLTNIVFTTDTSYCTTSGYTCYTMSGDAYVANVSLK